MMLLLTTVNTQDFHSIALILNNYDKEHEIINENVDMLRDIKASIQAK